MLLSIGVVSNIVAVIDSGAAPLITLSGINPENIRIANPLTINRNGVPAFCFTRFYVGDYEAVANRDIDSFIDMINETSKEESKDNEDAGAGVSPFVLVKNYLGSVASVNLGNVMYVRDCSQTTQTGSPAKTAIIMKGETEPPFFSVQSVEELTMIFNCENRAFEKSQRKKLPTY